MMTNFETCTLNTVQRDSQAPVTMLDMKGAFIPIPRIILMYYCSYVHVSLTQVTKLDMRRNHTVNIVTRVSHSHSSHCTKDSNHANVNNI